MNPLAVKVTAAALVVSLAVDLVVGYSPYPGYGASLGLLGCIGIIVVSKWVGRVFLDRSEDYYPGEEPPDVQYDVLAPDHPESGTPVDATRPEGASETTGGEARG